MAHTQNAVLPNPSPVAVNPGASIRVSQWERFTVYTDLAGGTMTIDLEVSEDDTTWFKFATGLSANSVDTFTGVAKFARLNITAYTSGTPVVRVRGFTP